MIDGLAKCLLDYADFLTSKAKYQNLLHAGFRSSNVEDTVSSMYLTSVNMVSYSLRELDLAIKEKPVRYFALKSLRIVMLLSRGFVW